MHSYSISLQYLPPLSPILPLPFAAVVAHQSFVVETIIVAIKEARWKEVSILTSVHLSWPVSLSLPHSLWFHISPLVWTMNRATCSQKPEFLELVISRIAGITGQQQHSWWKLKVLVFNSCSRFVQHFPTPTNGLLTNGVRPKGWCLNHKFHHLQWDVSTHSLTCLCRCQHVYMGFLMQMSDLWGTYVAVGS